MLIDNLRKHVLNNNGGYFSNSSLVTFEQNRFKVCPSIFTFPIQSLKTPKNRSILPVPTLEGLRATRTEPNIFPFKLCGFKRFLFRNDLACQGHFLPITDQTCRYGSPHNRLDGSLDQFFDSCLVFGHFDGVDFTFKARQQVGSASHDRLQLLGCGFGGRLACLFETGNMKPLFAG